jgi:hypothetical protein
MAECGSCYMQCSRSSVPGMCLAGVGAHRQTRQQVPALASCIQASCCSSSSLAAAAGTLCRPVMLTSPVLLPVCLPFPAVSD